MGNRAGRQLQSRKDDRQTCCHCLWVRMVVGCVVWSRAGAVVKAGKTHSGNLGVMPPAPITYTFFSHGFTQPLTMWVSSHWRACPPPSRYGFNSGSVYVYSTVAPVAAVQLVAMNTTLAASSAGLASLLLACIWEGG